MRIWSVLIVIFFTFNDKNTSKTTLPNGTKFNSCHHPVFPISCNRRAPTEKLGIIITNINSNAIIATNTSENDDKNKSSQKLRYWIN